MYVFTTSCFFMIDLAWHKSANQSSTWHQNHTADKAIDEDIFSCAETRFQQNPWWRVDLRVSQIISMVILNYRLPSNSSMEEFQVWIGEFREL